MPLQRFDYRKAVEGEIAQSSEMHDVLGGVAEDVRGRVMSIAPVESGQYRSSIIVVIERTSAGYVARTYARAPYAAFLEFGTRFMEAEAPMRRGLVDTYGGPLTA